ncbi:N-6 DNA methylase [Phocoenobacter skyensis]|uniref:N-6 DNA methylase n=1 Tax=Phocoenobacter skyensis TaxID=97481 RepID=UPI00274DFE3C|nr:N-6 DNA methylase [Pasteurella skyensis]MDP8185353.1 N-6 DNA methylase [Pasteurella skyensis]
MKNNDYEKQFIKQFQEIAPHYRRSEVFFDFIAIFSLELYLVAHKYSVSSSLQNIYKESFSRYTQKELEELSALSVIVIRALEAKAYDFLGTIFMSLNLGDQYKSQYFTPNHVADLMAQMTLCNYRDCIEKQGYISISEPCCGSGVMIIACYNVLKSGGFNPQQQMWVQARDLDFTAAMMCYIQMTLLGIPGEVIVGNTLTHEVKHHCYTLFHVLNNWDIRLKLGQRIKLQESSLISEAGNNVDNSQNDSFLEQIDWENDVIFY